jgi:hypothetical protein
MELNVNKRMKKKIELVFFCHYSFRIQFCPSPHGSIDASIQLAQLRTNKLHTKFATCILLVHFHCEKKPFSKKILNANFLEMNPAVLFSII